MSFFDRLAAAMSAPCPHCGALLGINRTNCGGCGCRFPDEEESLNVMVVDGHVSATPTHLARLRAALHGERFPWDALSIVEALSLKSRQAGSTLRQALAGQSREELARIGLDSVLDCCEFIDTLVDQLQACERALRACDRAAAQGTLSGLQRTMQSLDRLHERLGREQAVMAA